MAPDIPNELSLRELCQPRPEEQAAKADLHPFARVRAEAPPTSTGEVLPSALQMILLEEIFIPLVYISLEVVSASLCIVYAALAMSTMACKSEEEVLQAPMSVRAKESATSSPPSASAYLQSSPPSPFSPFVDSKDWERDILGVARCAATSDAVLGCKQGSEDAQSCHAYVMLLLQALPSLCLLQVFANVPWAIKAADWRYLGGKQ